MHAQDGMNRMTETNIEQRVSYFWAVKCKVLDDDQQRVLDKILDGISSKVFKNANKDNLVSAFEFVN